MSIFRRAARIRGFEMVVAFEMTATLAPGKYLSLKMRLSSIIPGNSGAALAHRYPHKL